MLEKIKIVDLIETIEDGCVQVRTCTRIMEDGAELTKTYHRSSLTPDQDLTGVPDKVVSICNAAWTPEVIEAYQASLPKVEDESVKLIDKTN